MDGFAEQRGGRPTLARSLCKIDCIALARATPRARRRPSWVQGHLGALAAYKDFLTLWKDADSDIPILKEAKAEYAKLQ